jgi:hypothetical protein
MFSEDYLGARNVTPNPVFCKTMTGTFLDTIWKSVVHTFLGVHLALKMEVADFSKPSVFTN